MFFGLNVQCSSGLGIESESHVQIIPLEGTDYTWNCAHVLGCLVRWNSLKLKILMQWSESCVFNARVLFALSDENNREQLI